MDAGFKFLSRFNSDGLRRHAGSAEPLGVHCMADFEGEGMACKLARELCRSGRLPAKEFFEAVEVFARVRKKLRAPVVADLCCGHGLTGLLFALFERRVERVFLIDRAMPPNHACILEAVVRVGPWVRDKVEVHETTIRGAEGFLEAGTSIVAVYACGQKTDQVLDLALHLKGAVAVMPCCYSRRQSPGSPALSRALGVGVAYDVYRTCRLEAEGYAVRWEQVPPEITPMHRIVMGVPGSATPSRAPSGGRC